MAAIDITYVSCICSTFTEEAPNHTGAANQELSRTCIMHDFESYKGEIEQPKKWEYARRPGEDNARGQTRLEVARP